MIPRQKRPQASAAAGRERCASPASSTGSRSGPRIQADEQL